jgi:hypothetical protein
MCGGGGLFLKSQKGWNVFWFGHSMATPFIIACGLADPTIELSVRMLQFELHSLPYFLHGKDGLKLHILLLPYD